MRIATWNVRMLYRAGAMNELVKEVVKHKIEEDDQNTDGGPVYKQELINAKLQTGKRGQKTGLRGIRQGGGSSHWNVVRSKKKKICVCHSISVVGSSHIYHCSTLVYANVMSGTEHLFFHVFCVCMIFMLAS